jgi:hypothetical protein
MPAMIHNLRSISFESIAMTQRSAYFAVVAAAADENSSIAATLLKQLMASHDYYYCCYYYYSADALTPTVDFDLRVMYLFVVVAAYCCHYFRLTLPAAVVVVVRFEVLDSGMVTTSTMVMLCLTCCQVSANASAVATVAGLMDFEFFHLSKEHLD